MHVEADVVVEIRPGGTSITKLALGNYLYPVVYVLADGREVFFNESSRLLRDAKKRLAELPRAPQVPMSVTLDGTGEVIARRMTLSFKPRVTTGPAPHCIGNEVTSSFQKSAAYRYIRDADHLPTYDELGNKAFRKIVCPVKLFNPAGSGTWWIAAFDSDTGIAWGVAELFEQEVGSFSMVELGELRVMGLPIERDLHYAPKTIVELLVKPPHRHTTRDDPLGTT